jgi:flagellar basal-body rod protein FlgC
MKLVMTGLALVVIFFAANAHADEQKECELVVRAKFNLTFSASNLANTGTTRIPEGGPYRPLQITDCTQYGCEIGHSNDKPILKYEPDHPDANEQGYVAYPNIDPSVELATLNLSSKILEKHFAGELCRSRLQFSYSVYNNF